MTTTTKYKATISFTAYVDDYENGETGEMTNQWERTLYASTPEELKESVIAATYQPSMDTIDSDQINDYLNVTEYETSFMADKYTYSASSEELERWKKGDLELLVVHCHVLVSKLTTNEETAVLA